MAVNFCSVNFKFFNFFLFITIEAQTYKQRQKTTLRKHSLPQGTLVISLELNANKRKLYIKLNL